MTQESSKYFQQNAGSWDAISAGYFGEVVRKSAIARAYLRPEMAVADIGSGTGFVAAGLAPLVRRVYAVDGSPEMLDVARKNLAEFSNIEFHQADGLELPFPEESLDAVFANMYLHHCPDPLAAYREMTRLLRPGGRLIITDMDRHNYQWLKTKMADPWQGFDRTQVRAWLREAGLVNAIVDCTGESCCATSQAAGCGCGSDANALKDSQGREAQISIFVAAGTRRLDMRDAVRDAYREHAESGQLCGSSRDSCCSSSPEAKESESAGSCRCSGDSCCSNRSEGNDSKSDGSCSCSGDSCCSGSAGAAGSCCCSSAEPEVSFSILPDYAGEDLAGAPQEAAEFSLGCGNQLAMAGLKPGEVVVDIGSGGGLDSFLAAARVGETGRVIGVDMTPAMLERARASASRAGIQNVEFRQGFAENLPLEDASVDVILSNCVINLTEDKGLVFDEAFRVLRPGGRLEVSDVVTGGAMPVEAIENAYAWSECVSGALPEQEYLDLIAQAGFTQIVVRRKSGSGSLAGVPIFSAIVSAIKPM